jgi:uncharacterized protein YbjT (DUF2867 family)
MKIVIIGGSGLIGSKLVVRLREQGHDAVAGVAVASPVNGVVEVAGPQQLRLDDLVRRSLDARHDPRVVVADPRSRYFGAQLGERTLLPGEDATLGEIRLDDWLRQSAHPQEPARAPTSSSDGVATASLGAMQRIRRLDATTESLPEIDR